MSWRAAIRQVLAAVAFAEANDYRDTLSSIGLAGVLLWATIRVNYFPRAGATAENTLACWHDFAAEFALLCVAIGP
jgi:hypothetical protein